MSEIHEDSQAWAALEKNVDAKATAIRLSLSRIAQDVGKAWGLTKRQRQHFKEIMWRMYREGLTEGVNAFKPEGVDDV